MASEVRNAPRAREADDDFVRRTDPYRRELLAHCYRMLGSVHDAEDQVQETLLRAWRAFDRYDARRASLRTWLYRIATNACLTALDGRARRPLPSGLGVPDDDPGAGLVPGDVPWLQPLPDAPGPEAVVAARGTLRLAFVAALQLLPARQRAVLILRDVLEMPAAEVAELLGTTPAGVNSALQRARARIAEAGIAEDGVQEPRDAERRRLIDRYARAFEAADIAALAKLLTDDVVLEMPPFANWYVGRDAYTRFLAWVFEARGTDWRTAPAATANGGQPAIAVYRGDGTGDYALHTVHVFDLHDGRIARSTVFMDPEVFELFHLAASFAPPDTPPDTAPDTPRESGVNPA